MKNIGPLKSDLKSENVRKNETPVQAQGTHPKKPKGFQIDDENIQI